jgi:hypothetical protein
MNELLYNTYYLAGMVQEIEPQQTFFRDRYFPTNPGEDVFNRDKVIVEYRDADRMVAPFVAQRKGDIPTGRIGYEMREIAPPYAAPSRILTLDVLSQRDMGEPLLA